MSSKERVSCSLADFTGDGKGKVDEKVHVNFTRYSSLASSCVKGLSFNTSNDGSSTCKRKLDDESQPFEEKKRKDSLGNSMCVSPWEFRRLRADLMDYQAQIVKLEDRIDELHKKNKETVIFFDKEKTEMKLQLESNRNTVKDLEYRLHKVRKREAECREELNDRLKHHEVEKTRLNDKILNLEHENTELKGKLDEARSNSEVSITDLKNEIRASKEENERLKLNVEERTELMKSLEQRLLDAIQSSRDAEETKQELQNVQLKLRELESEKAEYEEARKLTVALSEKVIRLPELEKELNAKRQEVINLRQSVHNKVMLEELIHDLKVKLAAVEDREKQIPILKEKIAELEIALKKWISLAADFCDEPTLESLKNLIESYQQKELSTSVEISNLNAAVRNSESKLSATKYELESMKQANEKLESTLQKMRVEIQVLRKKSILLTRERDSYRQQLDLYEKDLTVTSLTSESLSNELRTQMKERIRTLEDSLEEYRKHVESLEVQLKECQGEDEADNLAMIKQLKDEVQKLQESNKVLSNVRDELEMKLEERASKGEYLSPNTKVLHFRDNPVAEAQRKQMEEMASLKEECDKLRARIHVLESGEVMNVTQKVNENIQNFSTERVRELEKELDSANLKMQRLKEVYRKTSQEFCDVSFMLLGYRIVLVSNNKLYKLYNMYSTSPSDYLMFQQTKNGSMEMLGTPFAESLSKLVDEHLHKGNSIPAFLAAVTLSLHSATVQSDDDSDDGEDDDDDDDDDDERGARDEPPEEIELD